MFCNYTRRRVFWTIMSEVRNTGRGERLHRTPDMRQIGRLALRGIGYGLALSPLAAGIGLTQAEADDYLGAQEAHFEVTLDGESKIDLGPLGNAYAPQSLGPLGITAEIGGIPIRNGAGSSRYYEELLSHKTLAEYTALYNNPEQTVNGITQLLVADAMKKGLYAEAGLLGLVGLGALLLDPKFKRILSARSIGGAIGLTAATATVAAMSQPPIDASDRYPVPGLEDTGFRGLAVDADPLRLILDKAVPTIRRLAERQGRVMERYVTKASESLEAQRELVALPREQESAILVFSDLHCNQPMTELLGRVSELYEVTVALSAGDDTTNGTASEDGCVKQIAQIHERVASAPGNHDSHVTEEQMQRHGMAVLDGKTTELGGISLLGDDDPQRTPPFVSGNRVAERDETEAEMGERLAEKSLEEHPDIVALHQPTAAQAFLGTEDYSASAIVWGHLHHRKEPRVIWHDDGSWTVTHQLGTAGGAAPPTLTSVSTPFSAPAVPAEISILYRDDETRLINGYQLLSFAPHGEVTIEPRVDIAPVDDGSAPQQEGPLVTSKDPTATEDTRSDS